MGAYDDIINLPHPTSARHPRMPIADRAAIFSPFAALGGHGAAIEETARLTVVGTTYPIYLFTSVAGNRQRGRVHLLPAR